MMSEAEKEHWRKYYDDDKVVGTNNLQANVGRTKNGVPLTDDLWSKTIDYIADKVKIDKDSTVVELCCGNGQVIGNLTPKCKKATGVDYSAKLIEQMKAKFGKSVEAIQADALNVDFDEQSLDVVIIYASTQHFDEKETVQMVERALRWLKKGGRMFLGDIPDELKKWSYINKPAYRRDYIERLVNDRPMIGSWYHPEFFKALSDYFENITVEVSDQPSYQNNAVHRLDVLIIKN